MKEGKEMIEAAKEFAYKAHEWQYRRDGITPYFVHVEGVAKSVIPQKPEYIATAYLHDVIEDTPHSSMDLTNIGMPRMVVNAVLLLTKFDHLPYEEYLKQLKTNVIAKAVKIADINYNLNDTPTDKQREKYKKALEYLNNKQDL
jgi:(p)ppGpp synthase/HD superfamily hydrolase